MPKRRLDASSHDRSWIADWLTKTMAMEGRRPSELARHVGVTSQRISQARKRQDAGGDPPGLELLWRLAAVLNEDDESAALSDDQIRNLLECFIIRLCPSRIRYLGDIPHLEARELVDRHSVRRHLLDSTVHPAPRKKS